MAFPRSGKSAEDLAEEVGGVDEGVEGRRRPRAAEAALVWNETQGVALNAGLHPDEYTFFAVTGAELVVREAPDGGELARLRLDPSSQPGRIPPMQVDPPGEDRAWMREVARHCRVMAAEPR